jgi:hypothetical protein
MPQTVTLEIPESDLVALEATLDKVLVELRRFGSKEDDLRQARINQMRDDTHHLLHELKRMTDVEETL